MALRNAERPHSRAKWNSRFGTAFANRVGERLSAANRACRKKAETEHGKDAVAVALRDVETGVAAWLKAHYNVRTARPSEADFGSASAWDAGSLAGLRADIGQQRVPRTRRRLASGLTAEFTCRYRRTLTPIYQPPHNPCARCSTIRDRQPRHGATDCHRHVP